MSTTVAPQFDKVYNRLHLLLKQYEGPTKLTTTRPQDDEKYLQTGYHLFTVLQDKPKKPKKKYFGGIYIRKKGVALHLMPAYCDSTILRAASAQVQALLNGKACFLIAQLPPSLESEIAQLIKSAYEYHQGN